MFDILFARTFMIVGVMLLITAGAAYMNKKANTKKAGWTPIIMTFVLLFAVQIFADSFPINLVLTGLFAAAIGWMITPGIKAAGDNFKTKRFIKERGIVLKKGDSLSEEELLDLEQYLVENRSNEAWNKIIAQAMMSTALAVFSTASLVFISDIDFSFMGMFLFIALIILIFMSLLNYFVFKSRIFSLVKAYFGVLIFTLYLIYDFNTLERMAGDESWGMAVHLAIELYLDIINIFLYILEILGDS